MGNAAVMMIWLLCGVLGFVAGLFWLGAVQRGRRAAAAAGVRAAADVPTATILPHRPSVRPAPDAGRPDALAG